MKALVAVAISGLVASGIAFAAPANAGCQSGWTPWGGGEICDGPVAPDGNFQRCQTTGVLGFGGSNCFIVNVNSGMQLTSNRVTTGSPVVQIPGGGYTDYETFDLALAP